MQKYKISINPFWSTDFPPKTIEVECKRPNTKMICKIISEVYKRKDVKKEGNLYISGYFSATVIVEKVKEDKKG